MRLPTVAADLMAAMLPTAVDLVADTLVAAAGDLMAGTVEFEADTADRASAFITAVNILVRLTMAHISPATIPIQATTIPIHMTDTRTQTHPTGMERRTLDTRPRMSMERRTTDTLPQTHPTGMERRTLDTRPRMSMERRTTDTATVLRRLARVTVRHRHRATIAKVPTAKALTTLDLGAADKADLPKQVQGKN